MKKTTTACCALCQISDVNNATTKSDLEYAIKVLKKGMINNKEVYFTTGNGQTSVFVIASPGEDKLKETLKSIGFRVKHTFARRVGYPKTGALEMYLKNL